MSNTDKFFFYMKKGKLVFCMILFMLLTIFMHAYSQTFEYEKRALKNSVDQFIYIEDILNEDAYLTLNIPDNTASDFFESKFFKMSVNILNARANDIIKYYTIITSGNIKADHSYANSVIRQSGLDTKYIRSVADNDYKIIVRNTIDYVKRVRIEQNILEMANKFIEFREDYIGFVSKHGPVYRYDKSRSIKKEYRDISKKLKKVAKSLRDTWYNITYKKPVRADVLEQAFFNKCGEEIDVIKRAAEYRFDSFEEKGIEAWKNSQTLEEGETSDSDSDSDYTLYSVLKDQIYSMTLSREKVELSKKLLRNSPNLEKYRNIILNRNILKYEIAKKRFFAILDTMAHSSQFSSGSGADEQDIGIFLSDVIENLPSSMRKAAARMSGLIPDKTGDLSIYESSYRATIPPNEVVETEATNDNLESVERARRLYKERRSILRDALNQWIKIDKKPLNDTRAAQKMLKEPVNKYYEAREELLKVDSNGAYWKINIADDEIKLPPMSTIRDVFGDRISTIKIDQDVITSEIQQIDTLLNQYGLNQPGPSRSQTDFGIVDTISQSAGEAPEPGIRSDFPETPSGDQRSADSQAGGNTLPAEQTPATEPDQPAFSIDQDRTIELEDLGVKIRYTPTGQEVDPIVGARPPWTPPAEGIPRELRNPGSYGTNEVYGSVGSSSNVLALKTARAINQGDTRVFEKYGENAFRRYMESLQLTQKMKDDLGNTITPEDLRELKRMRQNYDGYLEELSLRSPTDPGYARFVTETRALPSGYADGNYYAFQTRAGSRHLTPHVPEGIENGEIIVASRPMIVDHSPLGLSRAVHDASDGGRQTGELVMFEILIHDDSDQRALDDALNQSVNFTPELAEAIPGASGPRFGMARYLGGILLQDSPSGGASGGQLAPEDIKPYYQEFYGQAWSPALEAIPDQAFGPEVIKALSFVQSDKSIFPPGTAFEVLGESSVPITINATRADANGRTRIQPMKVNGRIISLMPRASVNKGTMVHIDNTDEVGAEDASPWRLVDTLKLHDIPVAFVIADPPETETCR